MLRCQPTHEVKTNFSTPLSCSCSVAQLLYSSSLACAAHFVFKLCCCSTLADHLHIFSCYGCHQFSCCSIGVLQYTALLCTALQGGWSGSPQLHPDNSRQH
jgi:hypothetical protein